MRVAIYTSVADLPTDQWDAAAPGDFFFRREFLRVLEESGVECARYRYLVLRDARGPVGAAVLSAFTLRLDLLSADPWIRRLRRYLPGTLDVPIVCCGIPASFGQHHLHVMRPELTRTAVALVDACMNDWAAEVGAGLLFWKEWNPAQAAHAVIREHGYIAFPTLPDHRLGNLPARVPEFLSWLRSAYRRKYRAAAALMNGTGKGKGPLQLEQARFAPGDVRPFLHGYQQVMSRTSTRLETYPLAFFESLATSTMETHMLRLTHTVRDESVTALLLPDQSVLTFALVSKERARYHDALYTTLLQCIVLYGIERGFHEVRLGQTSSYSKCSVGAEPWRLEAFVRIRRQWQHAFLRHISPVLFPESPPPRLSVFRRGGE